MPAKLSVACIAISSVMQMLFTPPFLSSAFLMIPAAGEDAPRDVAFDVREAR